MSPFDDFNDKSPFVDIRVALQTKRQEIIQRIFPSRTLIDDMVRRQCRRAVAMSAMPIVSLVDSATNCLG